ncbi:hypothetical protein CO019_00730 [Candidatus Berkelbacteria bacterium CG_4_9_14_0_2_um_filter_42_30]|uniref:Uncharacterized protein n=3 Tax=Candidatus Berkelbacteria TaxID=1618330 RepID=A0A1J4RW36_9BACT|nr:MAG: hypothetical protein AUJ40_00405 [Candidatus Berkelbacteria bacterium CG1_02_42_45]PIZ27733.1 MAG: hypothetical protein COY45_00855 [Candidatus Berkelbacteria bacterium CG_4_10_14_0_8_um_filter_42_34]PJC65817.1 MAG: hypothetical protein CO019_00730 [Candidatus Berkelbacteria bacterium CG_4_9_14_0_2_um_filter_42_30]
MVARIPDVVGVVIVRVEPQAIVIVFNVEDLEIAIGVRNRLHGDQLPLAERLVEIVTADLRAIRRQAELPTELQSGFVALEAGGTIGVAEFLVGGADELDVLLDLRDAGCKSPLPRDVAGPLADVTDGVGRTQGLAVTSHILESADPRRHE